MSDLYLNFRGVDIEVDITSYYEGDPGRISGPPEDCYPPEPAEVEFEITCELAGLADILMEEYYEGIEEMILEEYIPDEIGSDLDWFSR